MATIYSTKKTHKKRVKGHVIDVTGPMSGQLAQALPLLTRRQRRELYRKAMKEERAKEKKGATE